MTHTVSLVANHKGVTKPRVIGDEYVVDANINITSYTEDGEVITASSLGLDTITAVVLTGAETGSGVALERFVVELSATGDYASSSTFKLVGTTASSGAESANSDLGMVRVRAYGNI
jgi:citrate lyase synthetase